MSELVVLYSDNHLLAVLKPPGLPTVPDESGDESLLDRARAWVEREFEKPGRAFLGVVHRLDRPVSGVVLFARTSKAAARLADQLRERRATKTYLGRTQGWPEPPEGRMEQWLLKDREQNRVRAAAVDADGAKRALTIWRTLRRDGSDERVREALVELRPETGRPHQLRVALASLGAPLLGDKKYGAREALPDRSIALHAVSLEVRHPTRDEVLTFRADPPEGWPGRGWEEGDGSAVR